MYESFCYKGMKRGLSRTKTERRIETFETWVWRKMERFNWLTESVMRKS